MSTWLDPIQHRLCSRSRCQLPIAGVGEAYGLCDGHGHEERNRRLAERDAKARAVTQRPIVRGLTVTPVDRPLSAIVGARPTPPPIQPSAATVAAKEPPVPKPLVLKPNADALPPTVCRIADCDTFVGDGRGARGLCSRHHAAALKAGRLDELALPSTQKARKPKAVAPTAPKPTFAEIVPDEDLRVPSVPAVVIPSSPSGELEKLRAERDAANGRAEQAERAMRDLESLVRSEFAYAPGVIDLFDWVRDIASKVREVKLRFEDWEARGVVSAVTLEHVCAELGIKRDGDADWVLAQLRERIKGDAAKLAAAKSVEDLLRAERAEYIAEDIVAGAKTLPWLRAAKECAAALGASTPDALLAAVKALPLDQHPPATIGGDDVTLQWIGPPILPEPKPHRVAQAGGHDLGVLVGYIDPNGLFRVTEGPKKGAVYGCLYRAEPMDRPVLGEPTPDRDVWVRTCIDEVTPYNIHTADGGRFRRSEWGPARFAPVAKSTPSSAVPGDDDLPF